MPVQSGDVTLFVNVVPSCAALCLRGNHAAALFLPFYSFNLTTVRRSWNKTNFPTGTLRVRVSSSLGLGCSCTLISEIVKEKKSLNLMVVFLKLNSGGLASSAGGNDLHLSWTHFRLEPNISWQCMMNSRWCVGLHYCGLILSVWLCIVNVLSHL